MRMANEKCQMCGFFVQYIRERCVRLRPASGMGDCAVDASAACVLHCQSTGASLKPNSVTTTTVTCSRERQRTESVHCGRGFWILLYWTFWIKRLGIARWGYSVFPESGFCGPDYGFSPRIVTLTRSWVAFYILAHLPHLKLLFKNVMRINIFVFSIFYLKHFHYLEKELTF